MDTISMQYSTHSLLFFWNLKCTVHCNSSGSSSVVQYDGSPVGLKRECLNQSDSSFHLYLDDDNNIIMVVSSSLIQLSSFPAEIIANIVSFVSKDQVEVVNVVNSLLANNQRHTTINNNHNNNDHEDDVYRALCLTSFPEYCCGKESTTNSWKVQYQILADWFPKQGFYSILEAAPWGMLIRLQLEAPNRMVGDLLWPVDTGDSQVHTIRIFDIFLDYHSNKNGETNTTFLSEKIHFHHDIVSQNHKLSMVHYNTINYDDDHNSRLIVPAIISDCPSNAIQHGAISIISTARKLMDPVERRTLDQIWAPWSPSLPTEMLQCLFQHESHLTLDWVHGALLPQQSSLVLPSMKPGLYSAVYERIYGKYKREIILVEFLHYELNSNKHDDSSMWQDIQSTVFQSPSVQKDPEDIFETIRTGILNYHAHQCEQDASYSKTPITFVIGRKVTGDFHVPMKQLSFGALLFPRLEETTTENRPTRFRDQASSATEAYSITQSWYGWGTLAHPLFVKPLWSRGIFVTAVSSSEEPQFGFVWHAQDRTPHGSILTRMKEQDNFPNTNG